jgi:hypothetical protein
MAQSTLTVAGQPSLIGHEETFEPMKWRQESGLS